MSLILPIGAISLVGAPAIARRSSVFDIVGNDAKPLAEYPDRLPKSHTNDSYDSIMEDSQRPLPKATSMDRLLREAANVPDAPNPPSPNRLTVPKEEPVRQPTLELASPGPSASKAPPPVKKVQNKRSKSPTYWKFLICIGAGS